MVIFTNSRASFLPRYCMKRLLLFGLLYCLPVLLPAQKVITIKIDGTINPASAGFISRAIEKAENENAACLVISLNTPGGLLASTRNIVSKMLESKVPVIVFVAPAGAHAGSAGVFITIAAHIAAMAPGTNIGAAHPVQMEGQMDTIMNEKATNDAVAFIRTIAEKRKRNPQWAEDAVRKSLSITETEALQQQVTDLIAKDIPDLLQKIDGKIVEAHRGAISLRTKSAPVEVLEMTAIDKLLNIISDPNLMYILFLLGLYGLLFEMYNPGAIFPGIVGVIALILAFYSMQTLPVNYAGLALIIFAVILFLLEIKIVSHGLLAIGGIISLLLGSLMLLPSGSPVEYVQLSKTVIIAAVTLSAMFFLFILGFGIKAQRAKPVTGTAGMIGEKGIALETLDPSGTVHVHGERWNAESVSGTIDKGAKVCVVEMKNMKLKVEAVKD
jgi:membrane-bound serine protease (ClpP class)